MIRIGILCPSEIAFRRFLPAVKKVSEIEYVGVAFASREEWFGDAVVDDDKVKIVLDKERIKAESFVESFQGKVFSGYRSMIDSGEIDAVYIPLPPALHYKWAKIALEANLHVFVEKPSTTSLQDTNELISLADQKKLALHENYMFAFHSQLEEVQTAVKSGEVGQIRLYRIDFGFPRRPQGDFRYVRALGGGALLDCGGYTLKYADLLLNHQATLVDASVQYGDDCDVEVFGSAVLRNLDGMTVQVAFGMDNDYRCNIDIWGSKGTLTSNRILTAPEGFAPSYTISKNGEKTTIQMSSDDAFYKSILRFLECVEKDEKRKENYELLRHQEQLVDAFMEKAGLK